MKWDNRLNLIIGAMLIMCMIWAITLQRWIWVIVHLLLGTINLVSGWKATSPNYRKHQ